MLKTVEDPQAYFSQWTPIRSELLQTLESEADNNQIPIVGPVVGNLLYLLARFGRPQRILELGTAIGYSAIFLGEACRQVGGRLVTLEKDSVLVAQARANITAAGLGNYVDVRWADVATEINRIDETMDMVFMDIEKQDYAEILPRCKQLLSANGLLVADNTGFKDAHTFNQAIFDDPEWELVNLWSYLPGHSPENDGICIAMKRLASIPS